MCVVSEKSRKKISKFDTLLLPICEEISEKSKVTFRHDSEIK